ncbi:3-ketoacyl-ACP reductase [Reichenbachiella sp. MALMAid0571]|uniref:3-ketoacyl-ACP reductase n=1 Tax=Reichenbachiella sp. MALMAid0571 TaxID=3143939 RepID=UPI0032DE4DB0
MNKYALVTGGTRGIGLGISVCLAKEGYNLAVNGVRNESDVSEVLDQLRTYGVDVIYCQGNLGLESDRHSILNKISKEFGQLDVLVNNAGVAPKERIDILNTTEESYDYVMSINLKGTFFLTQEAAGMMIAQKDKEVQKCIINISSISATVASVNRGEYCISKAGMSMITALFATRLAEHNIPVYEVRPGLIATDMTSGAKEKYDKLIADGLTLQPRWGAPEDIGKVVASMAIGQLAYSTGQVIMVDGGLSIPRL